MSPLERFKEKFAPAPDGCWLWIKCVNSNGYGVFDRNQMAHRAAYEFFVGPIPQGMNVLHNCDVRLCVNPDHLRLGTQKENLAEARAKGRMAPGAHQRAKTHCPYGHEYTPENTRINNCGRVCRTCERNYRIRKAA